MWLICCCLRFVAFVYCNVCGWIRLFVFDCCAYLLLDLGGFWMIVCFEVWGLVDCAWLFCVLFVVWLICAFVFVVLVCVCCLVVYCIGVDSVVCFFFSAGYVLVLLW